ncbi:MAG: hypothetical protein DHS20C14_14020 [Phycisphaeraceae bacterium]|nr:MAG: hypothetical protein DHS20C14_14020 [Phycisphaeraceae bacterium]
MGLVHRSLLFGGAIFAAGLPGVDAVADEPLPFGVRSLGAFVSYAQAETYNWAAGGGVEIDYSIDLGMPESAANITGYIPGIASTLSDAVVDATSVTSITQTNNDDFGMAAYAIAFVEFTEPTEVYFEWSFPDFGLCSITPPDTIDPVGGAGVVFDSTGTLLQTIGPGFYALRCYSYTESESMGFARITLPSADGCPCDIDDNELLNVDDVDAFVAAFIAGDLAADFDGSGSLNVDDVDGFVACFIAGCP